MLASIPSPSFDSIDIGPLSLNLYGLMIALGWKARWGALAILIFIIPVTLTFHAFWAVDPAQVQNQMNHFMKNLTIIGGMLYVLAVGPGRYSFDKR